MKDYTRELGAHSSLLLLGKREEKFSALGVCYLNQDIQLHFGYFTGIFICWICACISATSTSTRRTRASLRPNQGLPSTSLTGN